MNECAAKRGARLDQAGFTLPEVLIVILLMGIVMGIASSSWWGVVEGREVDSATNQLTADLRLAHTSATNQLAAWEVTLTDGSSSYTIGKAGGTARTRDLCGDGGCGNDPTVEIAGGGSLTYTFNADGTLSGSPTTFTVTNDGDPSHTIELISTTSRVRIDP